jgi:hypothetical protein
VVGWGEVVRVVLGGMAGGCACAAAMAAICALVGGQGWLGGLGVEPRELGCLWVVMLGCSMVGCRIGWRMDWAVAPCLVVVGC